MRKLILIAVAGPLFSLPAAAQQTTVTLKFTPSELSLLGGSLQYSCPELIAKLQAQINEAQKAAQPQEPKPATGVAPTSPDATPKP
jgi:hypothetical protein